MRTTTTIEGGGIKFVGGNGDDEKRGSNARMKTAAISLAALLALALGVQGAKAETIRIFAPSSVMEGGLIAQQVGVKSASNPKGCPQRVSSISGCNRPAASNPSASQIMAWYQCLISSWTSASTNSNYCEFRDQPGSNGAASSASAPVGPRGRETVRVIIEDAQAGTYEISASGVHLYRNGNVLSSGHSITATAGERYEVELEAAGIPDYQQGTRGNGHMVVNLDGTEITRHNFTVIDDDNSPYIGRRKLHPYGGTWRGTPKCWGPINCAYGTD